MSTLVDTMYGVGNQVLVKTLNGEGRCTAKGARGHVVDLDSFESLLEREEGVED